MATINLHRIFCHLVGDDNFLTKTIETNSGKTKKNNKNEPSILMANMVTEYVTLAPYEKQPYLQLPSSVKLFLTPDYYRLGIKNVMEKNLLPVNISFLNSINILLRPSIYLNSMDDHIKNLVLMENYIANSIRCNFQIDKLKNTRKVKEANKLIVVDMVQGKITAPVIQCVINIFEINLLIFDLTNSEIYFYWAHGHKYPQINMFNPLYCLAYVQGNYEPIMQLNSTTTEDQRRQLYIQFFSNLDNVKCTSNPEISIHTLIYLNSWNIDPHTFNKIIKLCSVKNTNIEYLYNQLK